MKKLIVNITYISILCILQLSSKAQTMPFQGIRLYHENDFLHFLAQNDDDNYTGGIKAELYTNRIPLFNRATNNPDWVSLAQSISYNVTAYTPQNLADPSPVQGDRPYASFEAIGYSDAYFNWRKKIKFRYELLIGKLGTQTAGNAQRHIHRNHWFGSDRPVPQGWQNQIVNGGALALNFKLGWDKLLYESKANGHWTLLRAITENEVNVGNYMINAASGLSFRILNFDTGFGDPETNPSITGIAPPDITRKKSFGMSIFLTPRMRFTPHNATLTGNLLGQSSVYTIRQKHLMPLVAEYEAGINFRMGVFRLGYSIFGRSREFKSATNAFNQWGGIQLGLIFRTKR